MMVIKEIIEQLCAKTNLTREQSSEIFGEIIRGEISEIELSALLIALKAKSESPDEIAGAAEALLAAARPFAPPSYEFADSVGTGGDGRGTVNISTAAAFVVAELGLPVAKHGNVSVSSRCGSADVLLSLGARLDISAEHARACLDEVGICFLLAPRYHEGMRYAMPVRRELKVRTIFNVLGPLVNPARPHFQLTGVYDPNLCLPIAQTLQMLGSKAALVVHGSGLDEIALHGPTTAALLKDGNIELMSIAPEDVGLSPYPIEMILGGNPDENALWLTQLLSGEAGRAHNAAVAINAGALYWVSGRASNLTEAVQAAHEVILSKRAYLRLEQFVEFTRRDF